jgi:cytochrome c553
MSLILATLKDANVHALGAYFAAMPAASLPAEENPDPVLTERGSKLAQQNRCASCHGESFEGDKVAARLARKHEEFQTKALIDYKEGRRRGVGMAAMPNAVGPLSSEDIKAWSHYLARLR